MIVIELLRGTLSDHTPPLMEGEPLSLGESDLKGAQPSLGIRREGTLVRFTGELPNS